MAIVRFVRKQIRDAQRRNKKGWRQYLRDLKGMGIALAGANMQTKQPRTFTATRTETEKKGYKRKARPIGHGVAWKKVKRVKPTRSVPKVGYKFKKKVMKVIDYDKPFGEYRYYSDQQLRQTTKDRWNFYQNDNNGILFQHFTPLQFWDAASVCFNGKNPSKNWLGNITQSWSNNIRYKQTLHVVNSYVRYEFKSTSSHVVNIEMYICTPKMNTENQVMQPDLEVQDQTNMQQDSYWYQAPNGSEGGRSIIFKNDFGVKSGDWSILLKDYHVEVVKLKFNPGEHKRHFIQGPKNFDIDGTKYAAPSGTDMQTYTKFSKHVFFRVVNDATVCGSEGPIGNETVARWPSNYQGGIAMRQERIIRVRMPENTEQNPNSAVGYAESRQNTLRIGFWVKNNDGDVDQQVVVNNPIATTNIG